MRHVLMAVCQACDDLVCYRPLDVPLTWTVKLQPLAR